MREKWNRGHGRERERAQEAGGVEEKRRDKIAERGVGREQWRSGEGKRRKETSRDEGGERTCEKRRGARNGERSGEKRGTEGRRREEEQGEEERRRTERREEERMERERGEGRRTSYLDNNYPVLFNDQEATHATPPHNPSHLPHLPRPASYRGKKKKKKKLPVPSWPRTRGPRL